MSQPIVDVAHTAERAGQHLLLGSRWVKPILIRTRLAHVLRPFLHFRSLDTCKILYKYLLVKIWYHMSMETKKAKTVRLDGQDWEAVQAIKDFYGISSDTDAIRFALRAVRRDILRQRDPAAAPQKERLLPPHA